MREIEFLSPWFAGLIKPAGGFMREIEFLSPWFAGLIKPAGGFYMRGTGLEPVKALSYTTLNRIRLPLRHPRSYAENYPKYYKNLYKETYQQNNIKLWSREQ